MLALMRSYSHFVVKFIRKMNNARLLGRARETRCKCIVSRHSPSDTVLCPPLRPVVHVSGIIRRDTLFDLGKLDKHRVGEKTHEMFSDHFSICQAVHKVGRANRAHHLENIEPMLSLKTLKKLDLTALAPG
jgi:hypothetical protein